MRGHALGCLMLVVFAACAGEAPVAPGESVTLEELSPSEVVDLQQQEQAELARIEARRSAGEASLDSLRSLWSLAAKDWDLKGPLLLCVPRQYDGGVKIIGPEGGDITLGFHRLTIPPGALDRPTVITAESPVSFEVVIEFRPHGLQFHKRPIVTLDYKHCLRPGWMQERVAYLGDADEVIEWPESHDRTAYGQVDALIDHFSRYAVAF